MGFLGWDSFFLVGIFLDEILVIDFLGLVKLIGLGDKD